MPPSLTTRRQHVELLVLRMEACLKEMDHWSGSFDLGDEAVGQFLDARIAMEHSVRHAKTAIAVMPEEE